MRTRSLDCRLAASLGVSFHDLDSWLSEIAERNGFVCSLVADPSAAVKINFSNPMRERIRDEYPNHHRVFFSSTEYDSNPFTVSFIRNPILLPKGVLIAGEDDPAFCFTETIGDSVGMALDIRTESVRVEKAKSTNSFPLEYDPFALMPQAEPQVLNIVLSSINNYGHWHVHNLSFCLWLREHLQALLRAVGAETVVIWCPHVSGGAGHKEYAAEILAQVASIKIFDPCKLDNGIRLTNALVCSSFNLDNGTRWPKIFQHLFSNARLPVDPAAPTLIYCDRSHVGRRGVENEAALKAALVELGFAIAEPGCLTYDEQRKIFSNASLVIGSHGAALTNMIYSYNHPTIIELTHPYYGPIQYGWFQNLAAVMGNSYGAYISSVPEEM